MKNEVDSVHEKVSYESNKSFFCRYETKQVVTKLFTRWFVGLFTFLNDGGGEVVS
jgi:hypothetical protein